MTDTEHQPAAPVRLIAAGHQGKLIAPGREHMPVRVFERGSDVLMLVVLLDADTGVPPAATEPMLLEYSSRHGLVRLCGEALLEGRELIRFHALEPAEILQRREFVRIDSPPPVVAASDVAGQALKPRAVDISGGGMLVEGLEAHQPGSVIRFTLDLGADEPPLHGRARVVRTGADGQRGVVFEDLSSADRQRLIRFIFDRQRLALARTRAGARRRRRAR